MPVHRKIYARPDELLAHTSSILLQAFSSTPFAARDMARMTLIGRLGGVPEKRATKAGKDYVIYKVATTDPFIAPKEGGECTPLSCYSVELRVKRAWRAADAQNGRSRPQLTLYRS